MERVGRRCEEDNTRIVKHGGADVVLGVVSPKVVGNFSHYVSQSYCRWGGIAVVRHDVLLTSCLFVGRNFSTDLVIGHRLFD